MQNVGVINKTGHERTARQALRKTLHKPQFWFGLAILAPTFVWYAIFAFGPILRAFQLSTVNYQLLYPGSSPFVGFDNFNTIFADPDFFPSLGRSLMWTALMALFVLPLSLVVSVCLASIARGRQIYQAIIFMPVVISVIAVALLFSILLDPQNGLFDTVLSALHLPTSQFLDSSASALPTVVGIGAWKSLGFSVVILTAGLLNIPSDLDEAARIDGANDWQRFWRMTLPLLGHTLTLVAVLLVIGAVQEFTLPTVLFGASPNPGPDNSVLLLNMYIYREAFANLRFGTASAAALIEFALVLIFSLIQIRVLRPKWSY
jgi:ABC-type sugar transport system permease subunit